MRWTNERKRYKKKVEGKQTVSARAPIVDPGAGLLNEERRRAILEILNRESRVLVLDLARRFETSQVTIRKDLETLHAHGLIHRTHGGALPAHERALEDPTLREKTNRVLVRLVLRREHARRQRCRRVVLCNGNGDLPNDRA